MQSRRATLPEITFTKSLIQNFSESEIDKYVCGPDGNMFEVQTPLSFLIGPEEGFDEDEESEFEKDVKKLKISSHILRAETAMCIAPTRALVQR